VQGHTPDEYLGRINAIWLAQDALGDSIATTTLGLLTRFLPISGSILFFGIVSFAVGFMFLFHSQDMRETGFQDPKLQET